jgi:hypothetical protein
MEPEVPPVEEWIDSEEYAAWLEEQELYAQEQEWPEDY